MDDDDQYRAAARVQPGTVEQWLGVLRELDPHFASVWLTYTGGLFAREQLDLRTRLLVLTGQYTMRAEPAALADTIQAAIDASSDLKEVLEVIFQCWVYGGQARVLQAIGVFRDVVGRAGLLADVQQRGLPADATTGTDRTLADEQEHWADEDRQDPRLPALLDTYDWRGLSTGFRLRPGLHFNTIAALDALDSGFAGLWQDALYRDVYDRGVLDDRTRLLCIVGDCLAVGETYQAPRHMRSALRLGATPAEVLEVIFQSCPVAGHPHLMGIAVDDLVKVLESEGRLGELVAEDRIEGLLRITNTRVARRQGVAETRASDTRPQ